MTRNIAITLLLLPCLAQGQAFTDDTNGEIQEIEVRAYRNLGKLKLQLEEAQVEMFDIFNDLNDEDRYDIHCVREAEIGTRIKQQVCRPEFLSDANRGVAVDFLAAGQGSGYANSAVDPNAELGYEMPQLHRKMEELARANQALVEAIGRYYLLMERYNARTSMKGEGGE